MYLHQNSGRPLPRLTWTHENAVLDDSFIIYDKKKVKNVLNIERLQRHHLHTVLTCQASNNNVSTPITSDVTLDMNCEYTLFFFFFRKTKIFSKLK